MKYQQSLDDQQYFFKYMATPTNAKKLSLDNFNELFNVIYEYYL